MISPTQLHQNQIDYVSLMHPYCTEQHLSELNTDSQSHLSMSKPKSSWEYINFYDSEETLNASYYADLVDHLVEQMTTPKPIEPEPKPKRKPFEPIELGEQRQIDPLDFPTYNTDGTLWEAGEYPNDKPKFTFTYEDHTAREKPPYPKHTIICYGKETMLNVMEHYEGYSYTIQ